MPRRANYRARQTRRRGRRESRGQWRRRGGGDGPAHPIHEPPKGSALKGRWTGGGGGGGDTGGAGLPGCGVPVGVARPATFPAINVGNCSAGCRLAGSLQPALPLRPAGPPQPRSPLAPRPGLPAPLQNPSPPALPGPPAAPPLPRRLRPLDARPVTSPIHKTPRAVSAAPRGRCPWRRGGGEAGDTCSPARGHQDPQGDTGVRASPPVRSPPPRGLPARTPLQPRGDGEGPAGAAAASVQGSPKPVPALQGFRSGR